MEPPTTTFGLVERFRKGESEAFSALFQKYRRRLAVSVYYRMGPELRAAVEVDDILQEAFLAASRSIDDFTYHSSGSFMAWLVRIAEHAIIDSARFQTRQKRHAEGLLRFRSESNPGGPDPVDTNTPSRLLLQEEAMRALLAKLDALPPEYRQVILLSKFEGSTSQEIADQMNKSREAVALLLHRALKRFRQIEAEGCL